MQANDTAFCEARRVSFESLRRLTNAVSPETRTRLAHEHDAFHRARKLSSADDLLLLVLFYSAANVSLRLVSWFAKVALGINICDQSLGERFKNCGAWLRSLVAAQLAQRIRLPRASAGKRQLLLPVDDNYSRRSWRRSFPGAAATRRGSNRSRQRAARWSTSALVLRLRRQRVGLGQGSAHATQTPARKALRVAR